MMFLVNKEKNIEKTQIAGIVVTAVGIFLVIFRKESLKGMLSKIKPKVSNPQIPRVIPPYG